MCSFAAASLAFTALGTVQSYMGAKQEGKAQQQMYNYQAAVDRNNAKVAEWQAQDAEQRGKEEERKRRLLTGQQKGAQRTAFAANGIDLGSESVAETLADTEMIGELDALTIRSNAKREAYGYRVQGANYNASAVNNTFAGKNAKAAANTKATSTILGGVSTITGNMATNKQKTGSIWG